MFLFVSEFHDLFPLNPLDETVWKWMKGRTDTTVSIPIAVEKIARSYEIIHLWAKNKSLALVMLRVLKDRRNNDILEHISSFLYCPDLDINKLKRRDHFARNSEWCSECGDRYVDFCPYCYDSDGYSS
jgi:hypothetical protein